MNKSKAYPTKYYIRFITYVFMEVFIKYFKIKKQLPKEVEDLDAPYLLLCNHVGFWDPFIVGHFLPRFTHFVSSDAAFRNPFLRFFLIRLGAIPKRKNIRDTKVIRDIVTVVRQGKNVGVFPEAVRNWSGKSFPMDSSIVKLIKMLKVPVVVGVLQGMNLFNPRWSTKKRRTQVNVLYTLMLSSQEVNELSEEDIYTRLNDTLVHDEVDYQRLHMNPVYSKHKAEGIGHALYVCPQCNSIDSFSSKRNSFWCNQCNYSLSIDVFGFYELVSGKNLYFDNIRDWYDWQETWMLKYITDKIEDKYDEVIFEDLKSKIYHSEEDNVIKYVGDGDVKLFIDRIEIDFINEQKNIVLNFNELQTINPQLHERLEIFYNHEAYRIVGGKKGVSALKWEVAVNAIWQKMGLDNKRSIYIKQVVK
ncbi:MAG: 1-acyl-sn-glycerol-3-phosphate acyltransferase [Cyclobacteriaceae bacterium]|nr:1-acyl-sn-glycerol-3-phosphate acyltransferase [Cyclobacteriaceae bacterium]